MVFYNPQILLMNSMNYLKTSLTFLVLVELILHNIMAFLVRLLFKCGTESLGQQNGLIYHEIISFPNSKMSG